MSTERLPHHAPRPHLNAAREFQEAIVAWRRALEDYAAELISFPTLVEACRNLALASRARRRSLRQ